MNLTRKSWSGWNPSQDSVNGNPSQLLRMDNLYLDEDGSIQLIPGITNIAGPFSAPVVNCFSKTLGTTKHRYIALQNGEVQRSSGAGFSTIVSGGTGAVQVFASTLGQVLSFFGSKRKRDDGTFTYDITPIKPTGPPGIDTSNQPYIDVGAPTWGTWVAIDGTVTNAASHVEIDGTAATPFVATAKTPTVVSTLPSGSSSHLPEDFFQVNVRVGDTSQLDRFRLVFILDDVDDPQEYYWNEWSNGDAFNQGINAWSALSCLRQHFTREGALSNKSWGDVIGIRVEFIFFNDQVNNNLVSEIRFVGGEQGQLRGLYQYIQVNVHDTGYYQAKSEKGDTTTDIWISKGFATITPNAPTDPSVNQVWIYRRSVPRAEFIPFLGIPKLDKWYRVLVINGSGGSFPSTDDKTSDIEALLENNVFQETFVSVKDFVDDILDVVANFNNRVVYMTISEIHFSDINDPSLIDTTISIRLSGSPSNKNLWLRKVGEGTLYIGTTDDIYIISGSLVYNPDGTVDIAKAGLGINTAPISAQVSSDEGTFYYMSKEGWKSISGARTQSISGPLNRLFQGHVQHGLSPVGIYPGNAAVYPVIYTKNKLWTSVPLQNGERWLFVYDVNKQYWFPYFTDPICLASEEDGTVIAGYGGGSGNYLRILDDPSATNQRDFHLLTIADDNEQPRNRKDPFTFKISADSGNVAVQIAIAKNGSNVFTVLGSFAFNGKQEQLITIAETVGLGKNFQVRILGTAVTVFKLYNFTIEYDARPEQLTFIRIPYTNLGTSSRKRFVNFPFEIDTLGVTCEFFPLVDGAIAGPSTTFSLDRKGTHIHYFDTEQVGTDIGGIICGFFEFYKVHFDEITSEKLPVPVTYLKIPQTDYGQPNRKRHSSYKFRISTRNSLVEFTPRIDGSDKNPLTFTTSEPQIVEYFFSQDTIGINIGGTLRSVSSPKVPFEFYGPITPQQIEVLPPRLKEFRIPESNYSIAARKRIRTMPMEINTNGFNATFTPIIDGVNGAPTIINTSTRATAFHYFDTDVFGVDFSGDITSSEPFEFYGLLKPEEVEILPVAKKLDQIGPIRYEKISKLLRFRLRLIALGSLIPYTIYFDNETIPINATVSFSGNIITVPNVDQVYEVILPKTIYGTILRFVIGPTIEPFHRYELVLKVNESGGATDAKWKSYK